jgi:hypothetical protein
MRSRPARNPASSRTSRVRLTIGTASEPGVSASAQARGSWVGAVCSVLSHLVRWMDAVTFTQTSDRAARIGSPTLQGRSGDRSTPPCWRYRRFMAFHTDTPKLFVSRRARDVPKLGLFPMKPVRRRVAVPCCLTGAPPGRNMKGSPVAPCHVLMRRGATPHREAGYGLRSTGAR